MAKREFGRLLVEICVSCAMKSIERDPERGLRNLVDLGRNFAKDAFGKQFLEVAQTMLAQENSAYYTLLKQSLANVDHERLRVFGINLGYNGCTLGARTIRANEKALGHNIPWALTLELDGQDGHLTTAQLEQLVEQGRELGIYLYSIYVKGSVLEPQLCSLFGQFDDCAFLLLGDVELFSGRNLNALSEYNNLMLSVALTDDAALSVTEDLRQRKLLYAVHKKLREEDVPEILSGSFAELAEEAQSVCVLLLCYDFYQKEAHAQIQRYVDSVRREQHYPFLLMEPATDLATIDCIISKDACSVTFSADGQMVLASDHLAFPTEACFPTLSLRELLHRHCLKTRHA